MQFCMYSTNCDNFVTTLPNRIQKHARETEFSLNDDSIIVQTLSNTENNDLPETSVMSLAVKAPVTAIKTGRNAL